LDNFEFIDLVGIIGGLFFLFAFYRTSIGRWTGKSFWYEMDNLIGAVLMSFYAFSKTAYIGIILNIVWGLVAFRGVSSYAERRLSKEMKKQKRKFKSASKKNSKKLHKFFGHK
jgi:hypothetical protein